MGPRFNGVEDRRIGDAGHNSVSQLQWGHALMAWKTRQQVAIFAREADASMGPRFNGVEDQPLNSSSPLSYPCFNGATL